MQAILDRGRLEPIVLDSAPLRFLLVVALLFAAASSHAFKLQPITKDVDANKVRKGLDAVLQHLEQPITQTYMEHVSTPVHEDLTHRAYGCGGGHATCQEPATPCRAGQANCASRARPPKGAPKSVIEGVQWNDNPPFTVYKPRPDIPSECVGITIQLPNLHPTCWAMIFAGAQAKAAANATAIGTKSTLLERSHFGDLQFLHAMAPDGESAEDTRRKILEWARFAYRVSIGEIRADAVISKPDAVGATIAAYFPKRGYDVMTLFTRGTTPHSEERMRDMAFGSLLHTIQDGFSRSHVLRGDIRVTETDALPGRIIQFHAYAHQDQQAHALMDALQSLEENVNESSFVTIVGRRLVALRARKAPWGEVEKALMPAFELADRTLPAGPGKTLVVQPREKGPIDESPGS